MTSARRLASSPIVIFSAALATRVAAIAYLLIERVPPQVLFMKNEPSHIASALVSGLGFSSPYGHTPIAPTAQQPPIYPLVIAAIFKACGIFTNQSAWAIMGLHAVVGAVTAVLVLRLGQTYFSLAVGTLAAWLWVLPWAFEARVFTVSVSSHALSALAFTSFLFAVPKVIELNHGWFLLGVCTGLLALLHTSFLSVVIAYGLWLAFSSRRSPQMLLAIAGLLLTVVPWTLRNYAEFGRLIPLRDNFGLELWLGNHPGMQGTVDYSRDFPGNDPTAYVRLGEIGFMDSKLHEARQFIASDPKSFVMRCLRRTLEFWYVPEPLPWIVVSIAGWIGAVIAVRKHPLGWLFMIPLIVFPLVYYVTHNFAYYRHPIQPVILLLAAYAIVELTPRGWKQSRSTAGEAAPLAHSISEMR